MYLLIALICLSCSCAQSQKTPLTGKAYFPLNKGNHWTYKTESNYFMAIKILKQYQENKNLFYVIDESFIGQDSVVGHRFKTFCYDSLGNIERIIDSFKTRINFNPYLKKEYNLGEFKFKIPENGISLWYRFDKNVGDAWIAYAPGEFGGVKLGIDAYKITLLSTSDTISIEDTSYTGCYRFQIQNQHESDTGYQEWLAPGVGLVRRAFEPIKSGSGYLLTSFSKQND